MKSLKFLPLIIASFAVAQDNSFLVTITNLTKSQIFSPPIVISHMAEFQLFALGQPASVSLSQLAEDGMTQPLQDELTGHELVADTAVAEGMVMPGESITVRINTGRGAGRISVAGMLVSTNDAFFAVDGLLAPRYYLKQDKRRFYDRELAWAYDAGTEYNSEDCGTIPGPPCGNGGVRDTAEKEGYVYFHAGIHGDADVSAAEFDWKGPVALVEIEREQ